MTAIKLQGTEIQENQKILYQTVMSNIQQIGNKKYAIVPISLLEADEAYQREPSKKKIKQLVENFDHKKMDALKVVVHPEEYMFSIINGRHRKLALAEIGEVQAVCEIITEIPKNFKTRQLFEAHLFSSQDDEVERMKPVQKHKAGVLLGKKEYLILDEMIRKYNIGLQTGSGRVKEGYIGDYSTVLKIAKSGGGDCLDYIFDIIKQSGWNLEKDGYNRHILNALNTIWAHYPRNRKRIKRTLVDYLITINPSQFCADYKSAYPNRKNVAAALLLQDIVVSKLNLEKIYDGNRKSKLA